MTELQGRRGKPRNTSKDSVCGGVKALEKNSIFGKYSDAEMIASLRGLALDPCNSEFSLIEIRPLWNQTIRVRKAMALAETEFPWRKRKLQQLLKALPGFGSGSSNQQSGTKLSRGQVSHASSASCLVNSVESAENFDTKILLELHSSTSLLTFEDNFPDKQIYSESPFLDEAINWSSPCKDVFPLVDSDDSVICSNPVSPENLTSQEVPSLNLNDISHHSNSTVLDTCNQKHLQPPRRSIRLLNFIGDHLQRMVIPVGPRFQADVPEWKDSPNVEDGDSESSRWLGTRIWPFESRNTKITTRAVGKGRPESCPCLSPVSIECIRRHVIEERLLLLCDIGSAFFGWKLDEMGEQVSKSWTLEEQHNFESLVRMKRLSNGKYFLKHALKCVPNKCQKAIINYYFNVFVPRRMSLQTRSSSRQVDTDEDEVENLNDLDSKQKSQGKTASGSSKDVKARFLRRPS